MDQSENYAREKNKEEYNKSAEAYEKWCDSNILMQKYCYHSLINEITKYGIEGKTFAEVCCGPCPIGQQLAKAGASKIYGLDISEEMISNAKTKLESLGILEKFEMLQCDVFDKNFKLTELVDVAVISYGITAFINSETILCEILSQCKKMLKPNGYLIISDFSYVNIPKRDFFFGMYTTSEKNEEPKEFSEFNFIIDEAPDFNYKIYNIPSYRMM